MNKVLYEDYTGQNCWRKDKWLQSKQDLQFLTTPERFANGAGSYGS